VPNAFNYFNRSFINGFSSALQNYFINQNSTAMNFIGESFQLRNCDFQGFRRGFVRVQGGTGRKRLGNITVDGCLFYNCGAYEDNGTGYGYFDVDNNCATPTNIFANVVIRNSSFIDSPMKGLLCDDRTEAPNQGPEFNVTIENNTFVNFNTLGPSSNRGVLVFLRSPNNSRYTIKKNLFIIAPAVDEIPTNYISRGARFNSVPDRMYFDVDDNYSTDIYPGSGANFFTSEAFNDQVRGFGINNGDWNTAGLPGLEIQLGFPSISPGDLMDDPFPRGFLRTPEGHTHNIEGFYYKNTTEVKGHEIYTRNIGDPRWRKNVQ